jgi:glycine/D-amino acid oxidase-like deaminating enzyme
MVRIHPDLVIFGGGIAGLWLLDEASRAGYSCILIEANSLGEGQTIASQGIIHGGLKYTLDGLLSPSAGSIREMPDVWRSCLLGHREPDLRNAALRAEFCHLWRTGGLMSKLGIIGARVGLRVAPIRLDAVDRPQALAECPDDVFRLDEQVVEPHSLLAALAERRREHIIAVPAELAVPNLSGSAGNVTEHEIRDGPTGRSVALRATSVIFAAGAGNAGLRKRVGLSSETMQRRPLHMVMLRGPLSVLNGHCAEGARTRITVTTVTDAADRIVWQVGGQLAEDGVVMDRDALIAHARREISACIPGVDLGCVEWATYRVDRAEPATETGARPARAFARREGNVITAWPTKLALVPQLAGDVMKLLEPPGGREVDFAVLDSWPRPLVAAPPWETETTWMRFR